MWLQSINLSHYRNYDDLALDFSQSINVFLGENAQGKTNLIESIYVLALARSHRTSKERELIQWQKDFASISGKVMKRQQSFPLHLTISKDGKIAKINHLEQKKLSDYIGQMNVILFAPEDLSLVKGSPAVRRNFLDRELGQLDRIYLHHLVQYQKILKQRNEYLKIIQHKKNPDFVFLDILTEQLAAEGAEVLKRRQSFIAQLEEWARPIQSDISSGKETLSIQYETKVNLSQTEETIDIYDQLLTFYQEDVEKDIQQRTTTIGPHRDDLIFKINERSVKTYGSQGQQRTVALSLKLAEIELMKKITGEYPILLLDDVLSELDDERQTHLLSSIQNKVQTFLTTTSLDGVRMDLLNNPTIFMIEGGKAKQIQLQEDEFSVMNDKE